VINGTKQFITNAGLKHNSLVIIAAVTGEGEGPRKRISNIIVPTGVGGFYLEIGTERWAGGPPKPGN